MCVCGLPQRLRNKKEKKKSACRAGLQKTWVLSMVWEDRLEEGMVTHFNILIWRIPWTEEPGGLWSTGLRRGRHDWSNWVCTYTSETVTITYAKNADSSSPKASSCLLYLIVVVAYVTAQNLSVVYSVINYSHYNYFIVLLTLGTMPYSSSLGVIHLL